MLFAHLVGSSGSVHTIEVSPTIFGRLKANLDANKASNVKPYNMAVSNEAGQVTVFLHDETNTGGTTILASEAERVGAKAEATVETRRLRDIVPLEELLKAKLLKIDVEGAEWLVLLGIRDLFADLRPDVEILLEVKHMLWVDWELT